MILSFLFRRYLAIAFVQTLTIPNFQEGERAP